MENKLKKQTACNNFDDKGKRTSQREKKRKVGKKITKQMKFCCKEKSYVKQH